MHPDSRGSSEIGFLMLRDREFTKKATRESRRLTQKEHTVGERQHDLPKTTSLMMRDKNDLPKASTHWKMHLDSKIPK